MSTKKPSNPKDVIGSNKVPFSTIPATVVTELAIAMGEGAVKYGKFNWRSEGVRSSIYYDAVLRHLIAWQEGEDIDPDSGLSHITKAIASLTVLRDAMIQDNWVDDRPPESKNTPIADANERFKKVKEIHKDCEKHFDRQSIKDRKHEGPKSRKGEGF
jgi:hypothetical protein